MTDVVEKRLELIAEEVEQMQKSKLFNADETRIILAKRKEFEHNIQAPTRELKIFTDYISYEKNLLKDIGRRRSKCKKDSKRGNVEHRIIKRVKILYEVALQLFSDCTLLFSYLGFCKKVNFINAASDVVSNMLEKHPENPQVWYAAAKWHAYDCDDTNKALIILLKGVSRHKNSQILYKEMVQIELFENDKPDRPKESPSQETCANKIQKIVNTMFQNVRDCGFYIELLELLEKYQFTTNIQESIIEHSIKNYSDNETLWHILAQRERKDPLCKTESIKTCTESDGNAIVELTTSTTTATKRTPKARLLACFDKYKQGLTSVPSSSKPKLWLLYIDFLLKLQHEPHGAGTVLKLETLKAALKEASEENCLSEKHYIAWLKLMDHNEALIIAEKGTNAIPESVDLWKLRLRLQMIKDTKTEVDQVFKQGINALKEKALPLWSSILRYHCITSDDDFIELIYEDGIKQSHEISNMLKPRYIEWLGLTKGIDSARDAYVKLAEEKPYCKDMHMVMAKLEAIDMENLERWGQVHKLACEQFGKEDVDVWINHIKFYVYYNSEIPNLNEQVQQLRKQAIESIPQELMYLFESKYNLIAKIAVEKGKTSDQV